MQRDKMKDKFDIFMEVVKSQKYYKMETVRILDHLMELTELEYKKQQETYDNLPELPEDKPSHNKEEKPTIKNLEQLNFIVDNLQKQIFSINRTIENSIINFNEHIQKEYKENPVKITEDKTLYNKMGRGAFGKFYNEIDYEYGYLKEIIDDTFFMEATYHSEYGFVNKGYTGFIPMTEPKDRRNCDT